MQLASSNGTVRIRSKGQEKLQDLNSLQDVSRLRPYEPQLYVNKLI